MNFTKQNNPVVIGALFLVLAGALIGVFRQIIGVHQAAGAEKAAQAAQAAQATANGSQAGPTGASVTLASAAQKSDPLTFVRPVPASDPFSAPPTPETDGSGDPSSSSGAIPGLAGQPDEHSIEPMGVPSVQPLPGVAGSGGVMLPSGGQASSGQWILTGVLESGNTHVAILRNGSERCIVKEGDWIDDRYRVSEVTRDRVDLRAGRHVYTLLLGAGAPSDADTAESEGAGSPEIDMRNKSSQPAQTDSVGSDSDPFSDSAPNAAGPHQPAATAQPQPQPDADQISQAGSSASPFCAVAAGTSTLIKDITDARLELPR